MRVKEATDVGQLIKLKFENGQNTIGVSVEDVDLAQPEYWAGALISLVELAVSRVPEKDQIKFEKDLLSSFNKHVNRREFLTVKGAIEKELV